MVRLRDFTETKAGRNQYVCIPDNTSHSKANLMNFSAHSVLIDSMGRTLIMDYMSGPSLRGDV
jgi:hypothetical protein